MTTDLSNGLYSVEDSDYQYESSDEHLPISGDAYSIHRQTEDSSISLQCEGCQKLHTCPQEPVLQLILSILKKIWKDVILEGSLEHLVTASRYILHLATSPIPDVPVFFPVTGSSSIVDSLTLYNIFRQCFRHIFYKKHSDLSSLEDPITATVIQGPLRCKTVFNFIQALTEDLNASQKGSESASYSPNLNEKDWIFKFFYSLLCFSNSAIIILIPNAENLPSTLLTTLIHLCYQARCGSFLTRYPTLTQLIKKNTKHNTQSPLPVIPVALVFGVSLSTVETIQQRWGPTTILKTITTSAHIFNLHDTIRLAANKLTSHLYITSFLEIPYPFLSTLADEVHQFSRSLEYFQRHVELYLTVLFSLVSPVLIPLLVPVRLVFLEDDKTYERSPAISHPDSKRISSTTKESHKVLCPTIELIHQDNTALCRSLHLGLQRLYTRLAMTSSHLKGMSEKKDVSPQKQKTPSSNLSRQSPVQHSEFSAHIYTCVLYYCLTWKRHYVLALLLKCFQFDRPLLHTFLIDSETCQFSFKELFQKVENELQRLTFSEDSTQQAFLYRLKQFFLQTTTHWKLWIAVTSVEHKETIDSKRILKDSPLLNESHTWLSSFMLNPEKYPNVTSVRPFILNLIQASLSSETCSISFISSSVYKTAWKITTLLLNPPLSDTIKGFFEQNKGLVELKRCTSTTNPINRSILSNDVFLKDFFVFYGYLLQRDTKDSIVGLELWFVTFTKIVLAHHVLVTQPPSYYSNNFSTTGFKKKTDTEKVDSKAVKYESQRPYGCLAPRCIWKRFLLVIQTLILLGLITEPRRSRKKSHKEVRQENVDDLTCSCQLPLAFKEYRSLLVGLECKKLYSKGEETGFA